MWQIPIQDGVDLYNKYVISPVIVRDSSIITASDVQELEPMIDIGYIYAEKFLFYFFKKYFDLNLVFNRHSITNSRIEYDELGECRFDDYSSYHFYTYTSIEKMVLDLQETANMIDKDFNNPVLKKLVSGFDVAFLIDPDSEVWNTGDFGPLEDHIQVVSDFYRRLAARLNDMMNSNQITNIINIEFGY